MKKLLTLLFSLLALSGIAQVPLLPMPQKVEWQRGEKKAKDIGGVVWTDPSLSRYAELITNTFPVAREEHKRAYINLQLNLKDDNKEAYRLSVSQRGIDIEAVTPTGVFYAIQTLRQLYDKERGVFQMANIYDAPAFPFRGYMVDVGRNYQSMDLLKQQIDVMAALKLNVFHFHLTEDVAWRFEIKRYPQLTSAKSMTRDHGLFYTEANIKELQKYCAERHITFIPEIDMPGHSKAFVRAMGFDMQTPEGTEAVLNILKEITETYDFDIIHIGGDEVKITDEKFLPTMIQFLESKGIEVMGWQPGGNLSGNVIRQLWGEDSGTLSEGSNLVYIDSRNLYVNHHDALEAVPLIFNHKIGGHDRATDCAIGATLCLWNDRRLRRGENNFSHNAVYPALFAFAERTWVGGGDAYSYVGIQEKTRRELGALEHRIISVHSSLFPDLPFQYIPQSDIRWNIYGPYDNEGDTSRAFAPELVDIETLLPDTTLVGGTIVLRHWWHPAVRGHFQNAKPNTTFYASRQVWSDIDQEAEMWIGFYDFSRSQATPTPALGTWNSYDAKIWLNGEEILPPRWIRAGQDAGNNEYPYEDENYIMRPPHKVHLKKGLNTILVKAPISSFNSGVWYAPNKWMFTAVFLDTTLR